MRLDGTLRGGLRSLASPGATNDRRWQVRVGLGLILFSYLLYPLYAALPFLSLPPAKLVQAGFGGWALSWGLFTVGTALVGSGGWRAWRERHPRMPASRELEG